MQKIFLPLAISASMVACGGGSDGGATRVSIGVKDAPVDNADAVVITFTSVELQRDGGDDLVFDLAQPTAVDLLALQGTNSQLLVSDVEVPPAVYSGIRFQGEFENASCQNLSAPFSSYITIDGVDYPLVLPSGELKVQSDLTVATGGLTSYVVDFDLRSSIAERGQSTCYNLRPVLRVVDTATVGSLSGSVDASLLSDESCTADTATGEGAAVYLYAGTVTPDDVDGVDAEPITSSLLTLADDGSGAFTYEIGFLLSDVSYTAAFTCNANVDDPEADDSDTVFFSPAQSVTIQADQTATIDFSAAAEAPR